MAWFVNDTNSIEVLGQKLPKLESMKFKYCRDIPYLNFLAAVCKSDKFPTLGLKFVKLITS